MGPTIGPICPIQPLTPITEKANFHNFEATAMYEGSKWGFLRVLNPSRRSPGVPHVPVHVYHVYQVLNPLPHPKILTFDWEKLQMSVRGQNGVFWGC